MLDDLEFEDERRSLIDKVIERDIRLPDDAPEDLKRAIAGHHQYRYLLEVLVQAALKDGLPLREAVPHAAFIVRDIKDAVTDSFFDDDVRKQLNFWKHVNDATERIRKKNFPDLHRAAVERAAAAYLQAPIRAQQVDRLLVDLLVAVEYFAYAQYVTYSLWWMMSAPRHPLVAYVLGQAKSGLFFSGIIGLALWMSSSGRMSEAVTFWTVLACLALFAIFLVIATIALPFAWRAHAQGKSRATPRQLLSLMAILYQDLKSDGAISALHIREKANKTDEQGVGWPPTLFALLDDIASRTGRF
jgi:hypothetical protein